MWGVYGWHRGVGCAEVRDGAVAQDPLAGEALVDDAAQGVDVALFVHARAVEQLGGLRVGADREGRG